MVTAWHADMNPIFPSKAMDKYRGPGHSAKRDLLGEMVKAFKAKGIIMFVYIHTSDGHDMQPGDQERLGWNESTNIPPRRRLGARKVCALEQLHGRGL